MSKAVKKVFKGVKKVTKKVTGFVKKYWKEIVLAAAVVFTAGAALGYVGMSAATGGLTFGAGAGAGGMAGVSTAFSALGNSALGMVGIKGAGGTGVFGQSTVAAMQGAGVANSGALAAAQGTMSGLVPQAGQMAANNMASEAALQKATETALASGDKLFTSPLLEAGANPAAALPQNALPASVPTQPTPLLNAGQPLAGPAINPALNPAVKEGGGWFAKQGLGDWAQMAGVGMTAYGAYIDDDGTPPYALAGDHKYHVDPERRTSLMNPKYRTTSASDQARHRYSHKISG